MARLSGYPFLVRQLRRVQDHMQASLDRELDLTELAGVAELSEGHFSRTCRQSTGQSPYRYLAQQRIERAKRLLLDPGLDLAEIALLVGYANQTRFGERSREVTGTSESLWRRDKLG